MTPRSILFVHSADEAFGSDRVLLFMVDLALEHGTDVRVLLPDDTNDGWLTRQLLARSVPFVKGPLAPARRRYLRPRGLPTYAVNLAVAARFLRAEVHQLGPEIVHINTSVLPAAAVARVACPGRVIWHIHEMMTTPRGVAWMLRVIPVLAAHDVVAISDAVALHLGRSRFCRARVHRIYDGLPARTRIRGSARSDTRRTCVFAGRLSERKGYDIFVEAAAQVAPLFPLTDFVVAGVPVPGEEWRVGALQRRIESHGLDERMRVVGMADDLPGLFDGAHIAVFPTRLPEGFGLAMVEAMRSGCSVVASRHGAATEIITHGETGILVDPGNRDATAEGIGRLLGDASLLVRLAKAGQRHVETTFSEERFRGNIEALWSGSSGRR